MLSQHQFIDSVICLCLVLLSTTAAVRACNSTIRVTVIRKSAYDSGAYAKNRWLTLDFFSPFQTQAYNNATLLIFLTRPIRLE